MIVAAFGMPGMSTLELTALLHKLGVTFGVVRQGKLVRVQGRMEKQSLYPVVFQNAALFLRTYRKFGKSRVVAFVLDNPYTLQHELELMLVGATFTKNSILYSQFTEMDLKNVLLTCKLRHSPMHFQKHPYSLTQQVLKDYSASSLSGLQTFLYKIKDSESRDFVSKVVKKWMTEDEDFSVLEPKLKKFLQLKAIETLKTIINSPTMKTFREAVRKVAANPAKLQTVAKEFKVNAFDIKYLLSTPNAPERRTSPREEDKRDRVDRRKGGPDRRGPGYPDRRKAERRGPRL
jgi:hypothetical protein